MSLGEMNYPKSQEQKIADLTKALNMATEAMQVQRAEIIRLQELVEALQIDLSFYKDPHNWQD